jgi:hypothetical protein
MTNKLRSIANNVLVKLTAIGRETITARARECSERNMPRGDDCEMNRMHKSISFFLSSFLSGGNPIKEVLS